MNGTLEVRVPFALSAVVLVLVAILVAALVVVFILVLILVLVLVLIVVLGTVLVAILVIHVFFLPKIMCGKTASIDCPDFQDLSLALKISPTNKPNTMAAAMPPAQAFRPPVKMPRNPWASTASLTPFERV